MNKQQRFYVELPTDVSIDDIHKLGFYPLWDYEFEMFYFEDPAFAEACKDALIRKTCEDALRRAATNISTGNATIVKESVKDSVKDGVKESVAEPIAINYKYVKFIIEAITFVEWILGTGVPIEILTFIVKNPIYTWEHLGMVVSEIIVVLMGLVIILFAITIGKVYLKNQYNNKLK